MESNPFAAYFQFLSFIGYLWWIWLPFVTGGLFLSIWLAWRQSIFRSKTAWTQYEIRIPREIKKSPKAMEHIFAVIWTLRNAPGVYFPIVIKEKWLDGEETQWFSFEIVSFGGDIHFYMRLPTRHAGVVKANFYSQYSDVEIEEVPDYMDRFPKSTMELYRGGFDLWGSEIVLFKGDGLPIRTYTQFESMDEELNLDPMSGLLEVMSKLNSEEVVMVQILARPADPLKFIAAVKKEADAFKEKTKGLAKGPQGEEYEIFTRTPGETEAMKQIEAKGFKPGFETMIRYVYFAPKSIYNVNFAKRGVRSAFRQFDAPNLNFFTSNPKTWTQAWIWDPPYLFSKHVLEGRKQRMLKNYRERAMPKATGMGRLTEFHIFTSSFTQRFSLLSTEELATIFHLPTAVVLTGPIVKRVESRKMGPPAGLPIYEEGTNLPGMMK